MAASRFRDNDSSDSDESHFLRIGFCVISFRFPDRRCISVEFGVWSLKFEVWSIKFEVWSLKFGVWSLKFGVIHRQTFPCETGIAEYVFLTNEIGWSLMNVFRVNAQLPILQTHSPRIDSRFSPVNGIRSILMNLCRVNVQLPILQTHSPRIDSGFSPVNGI